MAELACTGLCASYRVDFCLVSIAEARKVVLVVLILAAIHEKRRITVKILIARYARFLEFIAPETCRNLLGCLDLVSFYRKVVKVGGSLPVQVEDDFGELRNLLGHLRMMCVKQCKECKPRCERYNRLRRNYQSFMDSTSHRCLMYHPTCR